MEYGFLFQMRLGLNVVQYIRTSSVAENYYGKIKFSNLSYGVIKPCVFIDVFD